MALLAVLTSCVKVSSGNASPQTSSTPAQEWQEEFNLAARKLSDTGESKYFILMPGFQLILESRNEKIAITVLDETKEIGGIVTRVVEEREEANGKLSEVSRNFFAIDPETGDVFYFGEEVDIYRDGKVISHDGAWLAYENGNRPGLLMPGDPQVGMRYYQELAPGVAMDRAEVISVSEACETPAGKFENCLLTAESSAIQSVGTEHKMYAPGIGLAYNESLRLTSYGFV
ncbi:MAG TPA: hypothetical protein VNK95_14055, partial [Caldilineaceae bacterium]|nr:hypothetical protein [Caldilineaceae bacterium]